MQKYTAVGDHLLEVVRVGHQHLKNWEFNASQLERGKSDLQVYRLLFVFKVKVIFCLQEYVYSNVL